MTQFFKNLGRISPIKEICYLIVTCGLLYMGSSFGSFSDQWSVFFSMSLITASMLGLIIYGYFAYTDFTFTLSLVWSIVPMIPLIVIFLVFFTRRYLLIILTVVALIAFTFYMVANIQMILGQKKVKYNVDDYILADLNIYTNFLKIMFIGF